MLGEGVGIERVLSGQILHMNEGLGAGDPRPEVSRRFARVAFAVISVAGCRQIGLPQFGPLLPVASRNAGAESDAISAGRRAEYARRALKTGQRVVVAAFLQRGDGANGRREQRDLARKHVAEQAGNAQGHIDPRPAQHRQRQDIEAADAS